jgi:hypothetical protein
MSEIQIEVFMMCALARRDATRRRDATTATVDAGRDHFPRRRFRVVVVSSKSPSSLTLNEWSNAVWLRTLFHFFNVC